MLSYGLNPVAANGGRKYGLPPFNTSEAWTATRRSAASRLMCASSCAENAASRTAVVSFRNRATETQPRQAQKLIEKNAPRPLHARGRVS